MSVEDLRQGLKNGKFNVVNLTMGSDGRLRINENKGIQKVDKTNERPVKKDIGNVTRTERMSYSNTSGLTPFVNLICNNNECVVLEVKKGSRLDLIKLGYFLGDEEMIRLTKGETVTCTIFRTSGKIFSWSWGVNTTLVSDNVKQVGRMIEKCIVNDFKIPIRR